MSARVELTLDNWGDQLYPKDLSTLMDGPL